VVHVVRDRVLRVRRAGHAAGRVALVKLNEVQVSPEHRHAPGIRTRRALFALRAGRCANVAGRDLHVADHAGLGRVRRGDPEVAQAQKQGVQKSGGQPRKVAVTGWPGEPWGKPRKIQLGSVPPVSGFLPVDWQVLICHHRGASPVKLS